MRPVPTWDEYFLGIAKAGNARSKDPSTQVGCVLVNERGKVISIGYNGMAPGVVETPELWERPLKYQHVIHSETNAVGNAAQEGHPTRNSTAYCTHFPCLPCAKSLAAAGVRYVVAIALVKSGAWDTSCAEAAEFLDKAGIAWEIVEEKRCGVA